jgi:hypothetical protein
VGLMVRTADIPMSKEIKNKTQETSIDFSILKDIKKDDYIYIGTGRCHTELIVPEDMTIENFIKWLVLNYNANYYSCVAASLGNNSTSIKLTGKGNESFEIELDYHKN